MIRKIMLFIVMLICITIFTGCRGEPSVEQVAVKNLVSKYLNAEQNNNYSYMNTLLTGEALAEASINMNRKQVQKKYLRIELKEVIITPELATVYADITARYSDPSFNDRYAINFCLIQKNGRWLIYKVESVALERPLLPSGEIPDKAKTVLEDYLSLPFELKKYHELDYLAGQLLNVSSQAYNLYRQNPPTAISKGFEVQDIKSMGCSERYCIAKVTYSNGNNDTTITAVVDIVDVAGQWKITRLDIINQKRGD